MPAPRVAAIYRYPVKSMKGESLESTRLTARGVPGDRAWAIKDQTSGTMSGAKKFPALMRCSATFVTEPSDDNLSPEVSITTPEGNTVASGDAEVSTVLSRTCEAPVTLWPLVPADQLDHYRRAALDADVDPLEYFRALFARLPDEPLPDVSQFPKELTEFSSPPGTYFDAFPLLIMTSAGLDALARANAEANFDVRRFRPNIVLDSDQVGFPENDWVGQTVKINDAAIAIEMECPRCIMTTLPFDDIPKQPRVMRTLVQENGGNLGVYARVAQPGDIRVGDELQL